MNRFSRQYSPEFVRNRFARNPVREVGDFYTSDAWRDVRYRALKASSGCCQCCGARPALGKPLHVDHIKPRSKFPELELDLGNLQVLCADCNLGKSAWDQTDWRPRLTGEYLVRKGGKQPRAHIWTGADTACRMYSTGGFVVDKYEFINELAEHHAICQICVNVESRR